MKHEDLKLGMEIVGTAISHYGTTAKGNGSGIVNNIRERVGSSRFSALWTTPDGDKETFNNLEAKYFKPTLDMDMLKMKEKMLGAK